MAVIAKRAWSDIKKKAILGSDEEMKELSVEPEDFELVDTGEVPDMKVKVLEEALHQLTEKEYDVLMTYIEYDTDQKKHIPDNILAVLTTKYQTTVVNLRQIKCRALKKVKDYIEQHR
jgi:DNA-directed RNA polymerase sigma subunit (sigma70/sigma32)